MYNYGHFLGECIDSVLSQQDVDVDVLVINDASTDDSLTVANAIAARDHRVRVVSNERNFGMVETVNPRSLGSRWRVCREDGRRRHADAGSLVRSTALLERNPSVGFVYGFPVTFTDSPPPPAGTTVRSWTVWSGHDWLRIRCRKGRNCIYQPEVVMRADVLHAAGKYRPETGHAPDFDMWLRLATIANVGRVNGSHQGYYRIHSHSWQRTMNSFYLKDLEAQRDIFINLFDDAASELPDAAALLSAARRAVASNAIARACRAYDEGREGDEPIQGYVDLALTLGRTARRCANGAHLSGVVALGLAGEAHSPIRDDPLHARRRGPDPLAPVALDRSMKTSFAPLDRLACVGSGGRVVRVGPAPSRTPVVTVVVPCYNYGHYLPACVDAILAQPV